MYPSTIKASLRRKYAVRHFLAVTERTREVLTVGLITVALLLIVSYFSAHFLLYITGYYNHPSIVINHHK